MKKVYMVDGLRTYIGIQNHMYKFTPAEDLAAGVLACIQKRNPKLPIDLVIGGNAVGAGGNITRLAMLKAGLSELIPAMTIDLQCGSGLEAIATAYAKIAAGQCDVVLAGGFDSSSTAPLRTYHEHHPGISTEGKSYHVAQFVPEEHDALTMIRGAERAAIREGFDRVSLDSYVPKSHQLAAKARDEGMLQDIVMQMPGFPAKDEGIRENISEKFLKGLPAALPEGKLMTAGNCCRKNDGAAFVLLVSETALERFHLSPRVEILGTVEAGCDAMESPRSIIAALRKMEQRYPEEFRKLGALECNEAFSLITALVDKYYPEYRNCYNTLGGALAYGHPYGASGAIILLHLMKALELRKETYGVAAIAAAGGVGSALLVKNCRVS